ncbi:MAG: hypothetical protein VZR73_11625 [Acutalibacteraceae bacterium]|nr:hypothetical protein [Acutalibacteraceae bacterium]
MAKRADIPKEEYLKGLDKIVDQIQAEVDKLKQHCTRGLANALVFVGAESQKRAPVEIGDLRGSLEISIDSAVIAKGVPSELSEEEKKRIRKEGGGAPKAGIGLVPIAQPPPKGTVGRISYNTPYACNQHEHVEYNHPMGGQAKYLESVLTEEKDRIVRLIGGED